MVNSGVVTKLPVAGGAEGNGGKECPDAHADVKIVVDRVFDALHLFHGVHGEIAMVGVLKVGHSAQFFEFEPFDEGTRQIEPLRDLFNSTALKEVRSGELEVMGLFPCTLELLELLRR